MSELHPAFSEFLDSHRAEFNSRFLKRVHAGSRIDVEAFLAHLGGTLNFLVAAVSNVLPERVRGIVEPLYDISLDLFASSLLGPEAKSPWIERLWQDVLPVAAKQVAWAPQRVVGSLSNATYHVSSQPGTRPAEFLNRMSEVARVCESADQLLDAGKIAAWQAGMVQYRSAALDVARNLPLPIVAKGMQLPDAMSQVELDSYLNRMKVDPWWRWNPGSQALKPDSISLVATVGAFRGFGGPFIQPPVLLYDEGQWIVSDSRNSWEMLADAFGVLFLRRDQPFPQKKVNKPKPVANAKPTIDADGTVYWGEKAASFPLFANATSFACDGVTAGVTISTSHHVFLFGCPGGKVC